MKSLKITLLVGLYIIMAQHLFAQKPAKIVATKCILPYVSIPDSLPYNPMPGKGCNYPLSPKTFDKMLLETYSFTILGSSAPVSGLKFETEKPSVTLSGNLYAKKGIILNLSLSAGASDGLGDIFSKNQLSGFFKFSPSIYFLSGNNGAGLKGDVSAYHKLTTSEKDAEILKRLVGINDKVRYATINLILKDQRLFDTPTAAKFATIFTEIKGAPFNYKNEKRMIDAIMRSYGIYESTLDKQVGAFVEKWNNTIKLTAGGGANTFTHKEILAFDKKITSSKAFLKLAKDTVSKLELEYFRSDYNWVKIKWLSFTPAMTNSRFMYLDQTLGGITSRHSLGLELKITGNWLKKYTSSSNKYLYLTAGITPKRMNSLDNIDKFSYKSSTKIVVNAIETLTDEESGTAYSGYYDNGFGLDVFGEIYWRFSAKTFVPGFYGKIAYNYGSPIVNDHKFPLEFGLIYNLASKDKDDINRLSVIPYAGWTDLNRSLDYGTRMKESLHSKFMFGLKVGIPINIGK